MVIGVNIAQNKANLGISFTKGSIGGPSQEYQQQRQDALLATAPIIKESPEELAQNANSDALSVINAPINLKNHQKSIQFKISPPTTGWNWGQLHAFNAIDIANRCGTPIYAVKEGIVIDFASNNSWNNGYGNFILIEHANKIETLYAHLEKVNISSGQFIKEKELIASMGSTGNTDGPTGCHLHFEVHGAENPLAN